MFAASDGSMAARRVSGSKAGCSSAWAAPFSSSRQQSRAHYNSRCSRRRLRRQLTKMLSAAAVPTNVRVVTKDSVRVKRILAEVLVQASVDQVWRVLTDYNKLADFVPNLDSCERMAGAPPGKQRLRQKACSQSLYWRLQAEAVVDVREVYRSLGRRELHFELVEGDFQEFSGRWVLEPDPSVQDGLSLATVLRYEVSIVPKWSLPSTLVTTIIRCGLPANVRAIADKAEKIAEKRRTAPKFVTAALADEPLPDTWAKPQAPEGPQEEVLPAKGPVRAATLPFSLTAAQLEEGRVLRSTQARKYLGLLSVPVPFPVPKQPKHRWEVVIPAASGPNEQLVRASYPSFAGDDARGSAHANGSMEVHLRRLDDPLTLHRRVVASVTLDASREEVWQVLTDYQRLPEFVPNLAISERLETPPGAPKRLVRLRQVGYKSMMYMHLHAEATLALVESPCSEIQFRQLSGDFQLLQGKFILQDTVPPEDKRWNSKQQTALKYAVEVEIPRTASMLGLLEPLLEQVVYQDIPANLEALKQRIEQRRLDALSATKGSQKERDKQAWGAAMAADFELLEAELRSAFGEAGPLPSQRAVREAGGEELLQAIQAHGGFYEVSRQLGWKMDFQPRAQMSLQQLRHAFDEFAAAEGLLPAALPSRRLLSAKRPDLQKEADKWGGLAELAELWEYSLAGDGSQISAEERHASEEQLDLLLRQKQGTLRPKRAHMIAEFDVLAAELQRCFGEGPLPTITHIRSIRRNDLDVAIKHHGGPVEVSRRMGWTTAVGRRSPWSDLENCRRALDSFCREEGLPQGTLPSLYCMQQAKRYDLCTAVRHWGGLSRLARALGYQISASSKNSSQLQARRDSQLQGRGQPAGRRAPGKPLGKDMRQEIDSW